mmetsp:Transcript_48607/g.152541  ORF Transcript_48607/g.152541 Transcript_48607/m.152541 type:complete len:229 (-) Transcript_48607:1193-1879(-)
MKRFEAQLLERDSKLSELGVVHGDDVIMSFCDPGKLVLQVFDRLVLRVQHLVQLPRDVAQHDWVKIRRRQHLVKLCLFPLSLLLQLLNLQRNQSVTSSRPSFTAHPSLHLLLPYSYPPNIPTAILVPFSLPSSPPSSLPSSPPPSLPPLRPSQPSHLLLQQEVLEAALLLHVEDGGLELVVQLVSLLLYQRETLLKHLVLPRQLLVLVLEDEKSSFGVLERKFVLVVV